MGKKLALWGGGVCLAGLATYLYASRVAARSYRLEHVKIRLRRKNHRTNSDNLKILHLSDLHLCCPDEKKAAFLARVTDDDYDMVVITGDIFENLDSLVYVPSLLSKKPRLGAYAVLGNHDYYAYGWFNKTVGAVLRRFRTPATRRDVTPMIEALEAGGFQVLRNEITRVPDEDIAIIGIDYPGISEALLQKLVEEVGANEMLMALFHLPRNLDMLSRLGIELVLGGHTHGGQVRMPGIGAIVTDSEMPRHEAAGLIWRQDTAFHISRGLGTDPRTNFRLFCPPAVTVLEVIRQAQ
jgi:predicted MPP superfamily phosphohydrolase